MKPSNVRQIIAEDFAPEDREMISRLGGVLNYFMRQMVEILSENVDFDNLAWELTTIEVTVDADGIPTELTRFRADKISPRGVIIINAINQTNPTGYVTATPFVTSTPVGNGIIRINHVAGLNPDEKYRLTAIVI
jgi:hypothetical protein